MSAPGPGDWSASTGNRNMRNLRTLYGDYYRYLGFPEQKNPFADLSFKSIRTWPPFPTDGEEVFHLMATAASRRS